jgi:hypothetical protein
MRYLYLGNLTNEGWRSRPPTPKEIENLDIPEQLIFKLDDDGCLWQAVDSPDGEIILWEKMPEFEYEE